MPTGRSSWASEGRSRSNFNLLATGLLSWVTYVPDASDDQKESNVLKRITHRRNREPITYYKVVIPRSAYEPGLVIRQGSHSIHHEDESSFPTTKLNAIKLAHFPIRSDKQLYAKAQLRSWAYALKTNRIGREGHHLDKITLQFRKENRIDTEKLTDLAMKYATKEWTRTNDLYLEKEPVNTSESAELQYPELIDIDPLKQITAFTDQLIEAHGQHLLSSNKT